MEIKHANISDLQKINDLYFACSEDMKYRYNLNHWENPYPQETLIRRIEEGLVYKIISESGNFIGTFMLEKEHPQPYIDAANPDNTSFRYLTRLAVSPSVQSKGVGSYALKEAENIAKSEGAEVMRLDFLANYEQLEKFYLKHGYKHTGKGNTKRFTISFMEKKLYN